MYVYENKFYAVVGKELVLKVLFLTNIPSPYRWIFFEELGKYVDLTVLFERLHAKDRERDWHRLAFKSFRAHFLMSRRSHTGGKLSDGGP